MNGAPNMNPEQRDRRIAELRRHQPRSIVLRTAGLLMPSLVLFAWFSPTLALGELLTAERGDRLRRFISHDLVPASVRTDDSGLSGWLQWAWRVLEERAFLASAQTLGLAIVAIVLAATGAGLLATRAVRTRPDKSVKTQRGNFCEEPGNETVAAGSCTSPEATPDEASTGTPTRGEWTPQILRASFGLARSLPEYLLAFLLVAILPHTAWPAVLALALHNGGILGRLFSETLENVPGGPARNLTAAGAGPMQATLFARWPEAFTRAVSLVFYRFETCVRDATVLGMVGIGSLGYLVVEARARQDTAEQFLLVLCGATLVLGSDLFSRMVRRRLRVT